MLKKQKLLKLVEEYYAKNFKKEKFIPGKTPVHYSGRIFNDDEIKMAVEASLDFWLTAGRFASEFEKKMAEFLGVNYCFLTNSGSSANLLAISSLTSDKLKDRRLKPGDEVITTACGFPTTLNPIIQNNLIPVFIDVETGTYNIDAGKIEKAISPGTKAIFIAHTLGNPAKLNEIQKIAEKHNLWLLEDNCDALGSKYKGKYTGTFGHISTLSFYPAHHITMGEGGAVLTGDPLLKKIIMSFRDWGRDCWCQPGRDNTCGRRFGWKMGGMPFGYDHKYIYSHIGYNLKVTEFQAAIGLAQLKKLPSFMKKRKENFRALYDGFKKFSEYFILPSVEINAEPCWFGFPLLVKENSGFSREEIVNHLEKNLISTRMLFGGNLTKQPAYENMKYRIYGDLKNTDNVTENLFWLGVYPGITREMTGYIIEKTEEFIRDER